MKNVTLSLDENLLADAKRYAAERGQSLNGLFRSLLERELGRGNPGWVESFLDRARAAGPGSDDGKPLTREEIYDR